MMLLVFAKMAPSSDLFRLQVYLTKHYKNRRKGDPEFVLDFEEIYVIDSKTKSITRAKVLVKKLFVNSQSSCFWNIFCWLLQLLVFHSHFSQP